MKPCRSFPHIRVILEVKSLSLERERVVEEELESHFENIGDSTFE